MRTRACICITLLAFCHVRMRSQTLTMRLPPGHSGIHAGNTVDSSAPSEKVVNGTSATVPPASPNTISQNIPIAQPMPAPPTGVPVTIHAREQEKQGETYNLRGEVEIEYKEYVIRADHIVYHADTGEVVADGHLQVNGGPDNEEISASHGEMNLNAQTGRFYDVIGSVGLIRASSRAIYTTPNPFVITAKEFIKSGPNRYEVRGGSMTSCPLPNPHWRILAPYILVDNGTAKAWNSNFRLFGYPILYLPYVTHAVNTSGRQSGLLIPVFGTSSIKGFIVGESYYWAINRSSDLLVGLQYYSKRGFAQNAEFRFRGRGNNFFHGLYKGLEDRENQGGQDTLVVARRDLTPYARAVINAEYLSSYTYRQVFAENYVQAVSSEVKSWGFVTQEKSGLAGSFDLERYENYASNATGDQIRILHLPNLEFNVLDRRLGRSRFMAGGDATYGLLSRSEPFYRSHNVGRLDVFPRISLPLITGGWTFRPTIGIRETFYSHSQSLGPVSAAAFTQGNPVLPGQNAVPTPEDASIARQSFEADVQILPPVLERDFAGPYLAKRFGVALRHTIEPEVNFRYVTGINKFNNIPRFDSTDIYSNTNEVEYGVTQRIFLKRLHPKPCIGNLKETEAKNKICGETSREWLSWFVGQKYFDDPTFGGAVIPGRRNIFNTTLDFSGASYITAPRSVSPVISRLRIHTGADTDLEWDLDYDTKAGRVAASNIFANYRHGNFFSSFGSALLNAVGETPVPPQQTPNLVNYNQMQLLLGYGALTKPGLSVAGNGGLDLNLRSLEYAGAQATYNFDCCGISMEYRRFALGSVRNENLYSFSFTLAGVGTAGNLKRAERLF